MFFFLLVPLAANPQVPVDAHERANPVYRELCQVGLKLDGDARSKLPAPSLASDDPSQQKAILRRLAAEEYNLDELTRNSVVAPFILKINDVKKDDRKKDRPQDNCYRLDLWFVAYGRLDMFDEKELEQRLIQLGRSDIAIRLLEPAELKARGIRPPEQAQERYSHSSYTLLDRVQLRLTSRHFWSRTETSLLFAGLSDERFLKDKTFPNQWRPIDKGQDPMPLGPAEPYPYSIGYYQKITRLAEPAGALLVEYHALFVEPAGWFRGTNLLRSKLPLLIQSEVRTFRRELAKKK